MGVKTIIQEALNRDPIALKEALEGELRTRVALALEEKLEEACGPEDDKLDEAAKVTHKWYSVKHWKDGSDHFDNLDDLHHEREDKKYGYIKWGGDSKHKGHKDHHLGVPVANTRAIAYMDKHAKSAVNEDVQLDEISKKTLGSYIKGANADMANNAYALGARDPLKKAGSWNKAFKRKAGIEKATDRLAKEDLDEATSGHVKDGYYVTHQGINKITHDKPFRDSKSAISHADRGENKSGYVHRVHKVKAGKIDKQWEFNGGHHEGGWEHFSDFKGDPAHQHLRGLPKHMVHEDAQLDEISKKTLGNYVKKAYTSAAKKSQSALHMWDKADKAPYRSREAHDAEKLGDKLSRKARSRRNYANKAIDRLAKD